MRRLVENRLFSLADLLLVVVSGLAWIWIPKYGIWFTLLAFLPWAVRLLAGHPPFQRTPLDWLIVIFLLTAWIGYWAAYDRMAAWVKVWLIVTAVLLYYALSAQPKQNLVYVSILSFCIALGLSIHFFLTYDFTANGGWLANWWMNYRPQVDWPAVPHGYTSGLLFLTSTFAFYWLWSVWTKTLRHFTIATRLLLALGAGAVTCAFLVSVSRGVWTIVIGALLLSIFWKAPKLAGLTSRVRRFFPVMVLACVAAMMALVYVGPARRQGTTIPGPYGSDSRAELLARAAYLVVDYPLTGGGLDSFPGLYSQYLLGIPHYYFTNSYNVFMDVTVEQGLIGGLSFILICLASIWLVSKAIVGTGSEQTRFFSWLGLLALIVTIVHGLLYDYLYNGAGTLLALFPVGTSMIGVMDRDASTGKGIHSPRTSLSPERNNIQIMVIVLALCMISILTLNVRGLISTWYANLGAVQLSQVELKDFPTNQWIGPEVAPEFENAQSSLRSAVEYEPGNVTANYRLGMIAMVSEDFPAASKDLALAHAEEPGHRGIIKALGYCYVWLGNLEKARPLLASIPEAKDELEVYVWWWAIHGRPDLSANAFQMVSRLEAFSSQQMVNGPIH